MRNYLKDGRDYKKICEFPGVCERLLRKEIFGLKVAHGFQVKWK